MKLIFAGTPEFAATALLTLINAGHEIVAVYTQPDRPAGRGQKLHASAVKQLALQHGLPVYQPDHLKSSTDEGLAVQQHLASLNADVMVVAAYGLILPKAVLDIPALGCLNIHASLLPAWRGAAPIQRSLLAGDTTTGITIMQMDVGLDTGNMLYKLDCPIEMTDTSSTLHDKLAVLGGQAIEQVLKDKATLQHYQSQQQQQPEQQVSYAQKLIKSEAKVDWQQAASTIHRQIRAYQPWPVSFCEIDGQILRLWSAELLAQTNTQQAQAGQILLVDRYGVNVMCGDGQILRLTSIQWAGGKALNSVQILQAQKLNSGQILQ